MKIIVIAVLALILFVPLVVALALFIASWILGEPFMQLIRKMHGTDEDQPTAED